MNNEWKIEIIIVDLFRRNLWIVDKNILYKLYLSVKSKDLSTKEMILKNLIESDQKLKKIYSNMFLELNIAKNKISEVDEDYIDKTDINNLIK